MVERAQPSGTMEDATLAVSQTPADAHKKANSREDDAPSGIHVTVKADKANLSDEQAQPFGAGQDVNAVLSQISADHQIETGPRDSVVAHSDHSDGYVEQTLVVDSETGDADSSSESVASSTMSLRSSIIENVEENGRTYHKYKQGRYYLPNDEFEQDRLDLQHHLFKLTFDGRLNLAPIKNPQVVLDIGTGTGIWAMEFASLHPSARVIGTDLSAIQPDFVPSNCQFQVDDAEDEWTFSEKFDYIHGRALFSCFKDYLAVFKKAYDALVPGGYFEIQEAYFKPTSDDGSSKGSTLESWNALLVGAAAKTGRDWWCAPKYKGWLKEAGFEDVVERMYYWPSNPWPKGKKNKILGLWSLTNTVEAVSAISMALMTRVLEMSPEEVEVMCDDVRKEMRDKSIHAYYPLHVVYGRKPLPK